MYIFEKKALESWALDELRKGNTDKAVRIQRVCNRMYTRWSKWMTGRK